MVKAFLCTGHGAMRSLPSLPPSPLLFLTPQGEWRDGLRWGQGVQSGPGWRYVGAWEKDAPHGQGEETTSEGVYQGRMVRGRREGTGEWRAAVEGGPCYQGEWRQGVYHGKGLLSIKARGYTYEGDWHEGKRHGTGTERLGDGSEYSGGWAEDRYEGRGTWSGPNGASYKVPPPLPFRLLSPP